MKQRESGSALLVAIFVMTLVAIAAVAMTVRLQLDIYRVSLTNTAIKLRCASQFVVLWALNELKTKNFSNKSKTVINFPKELTNFQHGYKFSGALYELQNHNFMITATVSDSNISLHRISILKQQRNHIGQLITTIDDL